MTRLMYMRSFYLLLLKYPTLSDKLRTLNVTWSNICEILKLDDVWEIAYYLNLSNKLCLTTRELRSRIKTNEYGRLPLEVKEKLKNSSEVSSSE